MTASPDLTRARYGAATDRGLRVPGPRDSVAVPVSRSLHGRPRFPVVLPCRNRHGAYSYILLQCHKGTYGCLFPLLTFPGYSLMLRACCFTLPESEKPISMYLQHFNLAEKPFSTSPDPRFFYLSSQHREALAKTEYAVVEKLGLAVVYGDIGMGKTTVARRLLQKFRDEYHFNAVMLTHPAYPTENQLLRAICQEFRIGRTAKAKLDLLNLFQGYLLEQYTQGKTPVLIIDEAQTMRPPLLELLRPRDAQRALRPPPGRAGRGWRRAAAGCPRA